MSHIAGHYDATWDGDDIGSTRDGFRLRETMHAEMILDDEYGDAPVDGVNRGCEVLITLDYIDYDLVKDAIYAHVGTEGDVLSNVGKLLTGLAKTLVLTAKTGTPAASGIATLTADKAIIVSDVETLLASRLRQGPITFRCFPNSSGEAYATT